MRSLEIENISILIETQQKLLKSEKIALIKDAIIRDREYFYLDWDVAKTVEK